MVSDLFKDLKDNIIEKSRSPFGGAFFISWCMRNWSLLYTLYYFDSNTPLSTRIQFIHNYLHGAWPWKLLILPICYAIIATISYLVLKNITLAIFVASDRWAKPLVYKLLDRNRLITREAHEKVKNSLIEMKNQRDASNKQVSDLVQEKKIMEDKNDKLGKKIEELEQAAGLINEKEFEKITEEKNKLQNELDNLRRMTEHSYSNDLTTVFQGVWQVAITDRNGSIANERFIIRDKYYHVNGEQKYLLSDVRIDKQGHSVAFKKESTTKNKTSWVTLVSNGDKNILTGFESPQGNQLLYKKVE